MPAQKIANEVVTKSERLNEFEVFHKFGTVATRYRTAVTQPDGTLVLMCYEYKMPCQFKTPQGIKYVENTAKAALRKELRKRGVLQEVEFAKSIVREHLKQ